MDWEHFFFFFLNLRLHKFSFDLTSTSNLSRMVHIILITSLIVVLSLLVINRALVKTWGFQIFKTLLTLVHCEYWKQETGVS